MKALTLKPSSKLSLILVAGILLLLGLAGAAHGGRRFVVSTNEDEPCKKMTVYYHDILYNGENNTANATSAAVTKPAAALSKSNWSNGTFFGMLVVFDDLVTEEQALASEPVARVQGFYVYDKKEAYNVWISFTLVFDSKVYKGTLNVPTSWPRIRETSLLWAEPVISSCHVASPRYAPMPPRDTFTSVSRWIYIKLYECYVA
ncbi:unnamed protein product [Urochloa humidicola]